MNAECSKYPTTKDLIRVLYVEDNETPQVELYDSAAISDQLIRELKSNQLIDEIDIRGIDEPIQRKNAARIVHHYFKRQMKLSDIPDITPAEKMRDLYDCRVCANHIAQVYLRGIMEGRFIPENDDKTRGILLFEPNQNLEWGELNKISKILAELKSE